MPKMMMKKTRQATSAGSDMESRLAKMQNRWEDGKQQAKVMFDKLPEGEYVGKLVECQIVESKTSGNLMIKRVHVVTEGEYKGKNVYDNMNIETDLGLSFVAQWLDTIGCELPEKASEIKKLVEQISESAYDCKFQVKHSKDSDFINVRILEAGQATEAAPAEGEDNGVDLEKLNRKQLEQLIKENQLDVAISPKMTEEAIRKAIAEAVAAANGSGESAVAAGGDSELVTRAKTFCAALDVKVAADADAEAIAETLKKYSFAEENLDEEDKAILTDLGIYDDVVEKAKPAPKKLAMKLKK